MKRKLLVLALLFLTTTVKAQQTPPRDRKKFSHEIFFGYGPIRIPVGEWRNSRTAFSFMPEYNFVYVNKYRLKIRPIGWLGGKLEWPYDPRPFYIGQMVERRYIIWDILPFYTFRFCKRHSLDVGAGYSIRKGKELYVFSTNSFDTIFGAYEINDKGVVGELGYGFDISKRFLSGVDITYRSYDRGDPMISVGVKFGIALRH